MAELLRSLDQLLHDQTFQRSIAVLHDFPFFFHQLIPCLVGKIQRQLGPLEGVDIPDTVHKI